jgi:hypothetical protein
MAATLVTLNPSGMSNPFEKAWCFSFEVEVANALITRRKFAELE